MTSTKPSEPQKNDLTHIKPIKNDLPKPISMGISTFTLASSSVNPIQDQTPHSVVSNLSTAQAALQQAEQAFRTKQWQSAGDFAKACIAAAPHDVMRFSAMSLHAKSLLMMDQTEEALPVLLALNAGVSNTANTLVNIGLALIKLQRFGEAIEYLQRFLELTPNDALAYFDLGFAFSKNGNIEQAKASYLQAIKLDPGYIQAKFNLGQLLQDEELFDEARLLYEQIIEREPNNLLALSHIASIQQYLYPLDMPRQMRVLEWFEGMLAKAKPQTIQIRKLQLQPRIPLRIGFVSADLREHPVGFFLESTLEQLRLNPALSNQLKLIAYSNHAKQDEYSQRLHKHFDVWHQVDEWGDDRLTEQIKRDQIDILIDLSGHTEGHRLPVFALKAAPLQVSWLGYWGSTGLSNIDYVLTDPISVPSIEEQWFFEKVWRLPSLRYCFSIPEYAPEVSPSPCTHHQELVFGCFQILPKINQGVLRCWQRILTACPHAKIRIQAKGLENADIKNKFIARVRKAGIDIRQVDFVGAMARKEYLASHAQVDILLDTFPYPGGTTTAEALWMGVPTLTLALPSMLGRQGEALMVNAGLSDWISYNEEDYVQKAILWGNADVHQRQKLAVLRSEMREQVRLSPIFNAKQFAHDFVNALYGMWQEKCCGSKPTPIRLICATRESEEDFYTKTALGKSLAAHPQSGIELRLFAQNRIGLPKVYNQALAEAVSQPAILVFIHDDVHLSDEFWPNQVIAGLQAFDIIGLAGNRRRVENQPSWAFTDLTFTMDTQNLSGTVAYGNSLVLQHEGFYGPSCQEVKLLDGVLIAGYSEVFHHNDIRFDEKFDFHLYDLDLCRQLERKQLQMGTWPINIIHESHGNFHNESWRMSYAKYLAKWGS